MRCVAAALRSARVSSSSPQILGLPSISFARRPFPYGQLCPSTELLRWFLGRSARLALPLTGILLILVELGERTVCCWHRLCPWLVNWSPQLSQCQHSH